MKTKKAKFTFKKGARETGMQRHFGHPSTTVKLCGERVGLLRHERESGKWRIGFTVKADAEDLKANPNCDWNWIYIKKPFYSENACREYLSIHARAIIGTWDLRALD